MFAMLEGRSLKTGKCRGGGQVLQARTSGAA